MRHRIVPAALLIAMAGPVLAEPWIDYDLLRKMHADKVVVSTDSDGKESWRLEMGDGVTVRCVDGSCIGSDPEIAVGCMFHYLATIKAIADACSLPMTNEQRKGLQSLYERFGRFVAKNAVPEQDWRALQGYADGLEQPLRVDVDAGKQTTCAAVATPPTAFARSLAFFSSPLTPVDAEDIDLMLSKPRLPVMNPCL